MIVSKEKLNGCRPIGYSYWKRGWTKMFSPSGRRKRRVVDATTWPGPASAPVPRLVDRLPGERSPAPCQRAACPAGSGPAAHESNPCHTPASAGPPGLRASPARPVPTTPSPPSPAESPCPAGRAGTLRLPPPCREGGGGREGEEGECLYQQATHHSPLKSLTAHFYNGIFNLTCFDWPTMNCLRLIL